MYVCIDKGILGRQKMLKYTSYVDNFHTAKCMFR